MSFPWRLTNSHSSNLSDLQKIFMPKLTCFLPNVESDAAGEMYKIESVLMTAANDPKQLFKAVGGILQNMATFPAFRRWIVPSPSNNLLQKKQHFDSFIISASSITISVSYIQYNILEGKFPLQTSFMESCVQVFIMLCFIRFHWISLDLGESLGFPWIRLVTFYIWDISYVFFSSPTLLSLQKSVFYKFVIP